MRYIKNYKNLLNDNKFKENIKSKTLCLFIGAGVAKNIGMPSWWELSLEILNLCLENRLINHSTYHSIRAAINEPLIIISYCINIIRNKDSAEILNNKLKKLFNNIPQENFKNNKIYQSLCNIFKSGKVLIIQTNYDNIIQRNIQFPVNCYVPFLETTVKDFDNSVIVNLHGTIEDGQNNTNFEKLILTKSQYNDAYVLNSEYRPKNPKYINQQEFLKKLMDNYYIIFLGYSLKDTEIIHLIANYGNLKNDKEIAVIVDNCKAKEELNNINAMFLHEASNKTIKTYYYNTENKGIEYNFEKLIKDIERTILKTENNIDILKYTNYNNIQKKRKLSYVISILNDDIEKKIVFIDELNEPDFIKPLLDNNVLTFDDKAGYSVIEYLKRMYSENTKKLIVEVINKNIKDNNIEKFVNNFYTIFKKIDIFELKRNEIDLNALFNYSKAIYICTILLGNNKIANKRNLYKYVINTLLKYEIQNKKFLNNDIAKPTPSYDKFMLHTIYKNDILRNNFLELLRKKDVYTNIKKKYKEIIDRTSDLNHLEKQYIGEHFSPFNYKITSYDMRKLIIDYMSIYHRDNIDKQEVRTLLNSRTKMFVKLGFYAITENYNEYSDIFLDILNKIIKLSNQKSFIFLYENKYEFITILEKYTKFFNLKNEKIRTDEVEKDEIRDLIKQILDKFPQNDILIKYHFMQGLKDHPYFKNDYLELYKYFNENEPQNNKLYYVTGEVKSVKSESPIAEEVFLSKTKDQQIKYLNTYKEKNKQLTDYGTFYIEQNEQGLADLFQKILSEQFNDYMASGALKNLKEPVYIGKIFQVAKEKINAINIIDLINLINYYIDHLEKSDAFNFNFYLSELIHCIISNDLLKNNELFKLIRQLLKITKNPLKENNISFDAINIPTGRYYENLLFLFAKRDKLTKEEQKFIIKQFNIKSKNYSKQLFLYHLGRYFDYLYKKTNIIEQANQFNNDEIVSFLSGYFNTNHCLNSLDILEQFLLKNFQKTEHNSFLSILIDALFRYDKTNYFDKFYAVFTQEDKIMLLSIIEQGKYDKNKILSFIKEKYASWLACEFFTIYKEYMTKNILRKEMELLKNILVDMNKVNLSDKDINDYEYSDFLKKLKECLPQKLNKVNRKHLYNILDISIEILSKTKYLYESPRAYNDILKYSIEKGYINESDYQNYINKIFETPNLKLFIKTFQ